VESSGPPGPNGNLVEREVVAVPTLDLYGDSPLVADWASAALKGEVPTCSGEAGFAVQAAIDAAKVSAAEGRQVEVEGR
jgi:predicted dehydrogenase